MKKHLVSTALAAALGTLVAIPSAHAAAAVLEFVAVDPCRVLDTREMATDPTADDTVISFSTNDASFATQGGNVDGCGLAGDSTGTVNDIDPLAVAVTVTTTQQGGNGHLQLFPYNPAGAVLPNASMLNYKAVDIANTTTVKQYVNDTADVLHPDDASGEVGANELSIYMSVDTHIVVDVVGYYVAAGSTSAPLVP